MIQLEKPSECAEGERCYCGSPAWTKVEEVIFFDDPSWDDMTNTCFGMHPFMAYICRVHFNQIMGIKDGAEI